MKKLIAIGMAAALLATSVPALAERHEHEREHEGHWRGHEIHRFRDHDIHVWRGGHWYHGYHEGRLGWWWLAAGLWYFYPAPVYPYPDPYSPPVVVVPQATVSSPPVVAAPQMPTQYWYYCASAKGYYPYVPSCPEPWQRVPAQPADAPQ